jgi:hypothetical protein
MKKKTLSIGAGAAALALGAGVFAWAPNQLTITGLSAAGQGEVTAACYTEELELTADDPSYDADLERWSIQSLQIVGANGDASACEGQYVKVFKIDDMGFADLVGQEYVDSFDVDYDMNGFNAINKFVFLDDDFTLSGFAGAGLDPNGLAGWKIVISEKPAMVTPPF